MTTLTPGACPIGGEWIGGDAVISVRDPADDTPCALATYLYTADGRRAWRVGEALEAGMVGINIGLISTEVAPFGGIKASGIGREGARARGREGARARGREGARQELEDYLECKTLSVAS